MATTITMPQLGETITEGTILSWAKKAGDTIAEDEVLFEISTDKVDTEVPSPAAGVIQEILVAEGETVTVGTPLVVILTAEEAASGVVAPVGGPAAASEPEPAPEPVPAAVEPPPAPEPVAATAPEPASAPPAPPEMPAVSADAPKRGVLSPVVRKLAAENNIDLALVAGTGGGGRITRKDVSKYIDAQRSGGTPPPPPAAPTAEVTFEPAPAAPTPAAPTPAAPTPAAPTPAAPTPAPVVEQPVAQPPVAPPPVAAPAAATTPVATESVAPETAAAAATVGDRVEPMPRLRKVIAENMINAKRTAAHVWTSVEVDYERV